jgi:hypothetical protein
MTFRTRKEEFRAETAAPSSVVAQSDNPTVQPRDGPQPDDADLLIGFPRMSEFAIAEGYPVATSTLQKRGSPAISTGPELVGYFGQRPTTNKGLMRAWLRSELRTNRPADKRRKTPIPTAQAAEAATP